MTIEKYEKNIDIDEIYSSIVDVAREGGAKLAIIFGSFARRDYSQKSDIDLIFVEDTQERFMDRIGRYFDALKNKAELYPFSMDIFVYTPREYEMMKENENRFILRAIREGKLLYEQREEQKDRVKMV